MSELVSGPEQLNLPFDAESEVAGSAKIFSFAEHRQRTHISKSIDPTDSCSPDEISKALERRILEEVLAEAEKLPWYK